ncbi:TetR/AcrR family transcriptional regulator [Antrihabitans sp. YC3-6]|uniref:TetR/AcrR family transcriptional regulator n=1 Tax=Antrihabitans stalagmiti TaxID=2799499 RepID=A0A934NVU5_9NOCA|nr:TetR/AcrR family transcriptional regulator [Antrihabitans stalagmiti]MBJ8342214.1 TetR/AcrR family transcriptional regulator [Antrihabitans stalagmiti]
MKKGDQVVGTGSSRSDRKRAAIVAAAREVFLRHGYAGATMDDVAELAGASKVTVYKHFSDKPSLFTAVFTTAIDDVAAASRPLVDSLGDSTDIEGDLRRFARDHVVSVTAPDLVRMRRMIIAEAERFPDVAAAWHRAGPERGHRSLAEQIRKLTARGLLRATDPMLAAQNLNYLILSVPLNEAMFVVGVDPPSIRRLHRYADEAVRLFIAAYGVAACGVPDADPA